MLRHHSSTPIHEYGTGEVKRNNKRYPHYLNFYDIPPTDNISIEEFEKFALDRLQGMQYTQKYTDNAIKYFRRFCVFVTFIYYVNSFESSGSSNITPQTRK